MRSLLRRLTPPSRRHVNRVLIAALMLLIVTGWLTWVHGASFAWWRLSFDVRAGAAELSWFVRYDELLGLTRLDLVPNGPTSFANGTGWNRWGFHAGSDSYRVYLYTPLWLPLLLLIGGIALTWPKRIHLPGHCASCGYDLRGVGNASEGNTAKVVCPECGHQAANNVA